MRILGVLKKPRFVGQVFNLNHTSAIFSDNAGLHNQLFGPLVGLLEILL